MRTGRLSSEESPSWEAAGLRAGVRLSHRFPCGQLCLPSLALHLYQPCIGWPSHESGRKMHDPRHVFLAISPSFSHVLSGHFPFLSSLPLIFISSVQFSCSFVSFVTPWTAARQASLSITNSQSLLKLTPIESVMPSNHLILCHPHLLLPSIFPSIRVFSNESVLRIRWPKDWSFSFSIVPSNEYSGLISFRMDWLDLLAVQGILKSLLQHHSSKASILWCSAFFIVQLSHLYMTIGKTIALIRQTFVGKVMSLLYSMLSSIFICGWHISVCFRKIDVLSVLMTEMLSLRRKSYSSPPRFNRRGGSRGYALLFPWAFKKEAKISTIGSTVAAGRASRGRNKPLVSHQQLRGRSGGREARLSSEATSFSPLQPAFQVRKEAVPGWKDNSGLPVVNKHVNRPLQFRRACDVQHEVSHLGLEVHGHPQREVAADK